MVAGILVGMELVVRREILARLETEIDNTTEALQASLLGTLARISAEARVVSEEPRLKAVVHMPDIDSATRDDVALELREGIGWDILGLADPDGRLLTLVGAVGEADPPAAVGDSLLTGMSQGYWLEGGHLYQTVAVRLAFGDQVVGALMAGVDLSDDRAEELRQATHAHVAFFDRDRLVAASIASGPQRTALAELGRSNLPREARLGGESFLLRELPLGTGEVRAVALQSKEAALGPYLRLRRAVLAIGGVALLAAVGLAALMSRSLARPVGRLAELARAVAAGNLDVRMDLKGAKELRELGATFNEMVQEVAHQRRRDELASFLVHDLKSPLTSVLLQARMLAADESLSPAAREGAGDVVAAAESVLGMVLDLLDVASSVDGQLVPQREEFDLAELVEQVRRSAAGRAALRRQRVTVTAEGPLRIVADRDLLRRVLDNLLDNSFKYTPPGGTIGVECRPGGPGEVELRVRDEGPGIPEAMRERIFDKYFRLDRDAFVHGRVSRGLGLVFCRAAAEAHGGRIWVEDNVPRGTTFCLRLPLGA
ncbi:MAG TPA: HAMP domain-containing sensor histidine kinase [Anaeromyxobacteraceae bacterium]|nr:HAMP domain-containing sensor histidine kinase [Anaeromyxobacteraceae bacterium]